MFRPDRHPGCRVGSPARPGHGFPRNHTRQFTLTTHLRPGPREVSGRPPPMRVQSTGQPTGVSLSSPVNTLWLVCHSPPRPAALRPGFLSSANWRVGFLVSLAETCPAAGPSGHVTRHPSTHHQLARRLVVSLADRSTDRSRRATTLQCAPQPAHEVPLGAPRPTHSRRPPSPPVRIIIARTICTNLSKSLQPTGIPDSTEDSGPGPVLV